MGTFVPQQHCTILKALATHTAGIRSFPGRSHTRCCEHGDSLSQSIICSFKAWKVAKGKGCGLGFLGFFFQKHTSWLFKTQATAGLIIVIPVGRSPGVQHWLQQLWLRSWEAGISQPMLLGAHPLLGQCFLRNLPKESNPNTQQVCTYKRQMK